MLMRAARKEDDEMPAMHSKEAKSQHTEHKQPI